MESPSASSPPSSRGCSLDTPGLVRSEGKKGWPQLLFTVFLDLLRRDRVGVWEGSCIGGLGLRTSVEKKNKARGPFILSKIVSCPLSPSRDGTMPLGISVGSTGSSVS